ncbi:MAG: hypothetical protein M5U28_23070 [Sandaracinaceae bacterium]|nr:hypothetical protein [Sandaracinaceae bacterium]
MSQISAVRTPRARSDSSAVAAPGEGRDVEREPSLLEAMRELLRELHVLELEGLERPLRDLARAAARAASPVLDVSRVCRAEQRFRSILVQPDALRGGDLAQRRNPKRPCHLAAALDQQRVPAVERDGGGQAHDGWSIGRGDQYRSQSSYAVGSASAGLARLVDRTQSPRVRRSARSVPIQCEVGRTIISWQHLDHHVQRAAPCRPRDRSWSAT